MVVGPIDQDSVQGDTRRFAASWAGFYFSQPADHYRCFDWELFMDSLDDWISIGPDDDNPPWYTGEAWG